LFCNIFFGKEYFASGRSDIDTFDVQESSSLILGGEGVGALFEPDYDASSGKNSVVTDLYFGSG